MSNKINTTFVSPQAPKSADPTPTAIPSTPPGIESKFVVPAALQYQGDSFNPKAATGPFVPEPGFSPNLTSHGGAVLTAPAISNIYVGGYWNTAQGKADAKENDAAAVDFGKSKMMDVLSQYGTGKTSFIGSTVQPSSLTTFTDADIQAAVKTAIANGSAKKNAQGIYTVILPPHAVLDLGGGADSLHGLGGYHGSFDDGTGKPVYFSGIAYSDAKNGINFDGNSQDAVNITETHEWAEAMTDPDVNSTIPGRGLGWYDDTNNGEIGDLMMPQELNAGLPISQSFEKDAGGFMQQMEWGQKDKLFEIDTQSSPKPTPNN